MKPTIKDVAKLANVSFKTVSRVINEESAVGKKTRDKVWAAIRELNYSPNRAARGLRGTTSSIAFIYDNPNSNYVIAMQHGILGECRKQGYELVIHPCDSSRKDLVEEALEMIERSQVGGLVLTPPISENDEVVDAFVEHGIRFVRIVSGSQPPDDRSSCIFIDDRQAAFEETRHLIDLGHSDIAFLGGDEEHASSGERLKGFQLAMQEYGLSVEPERILPGQYSFESGVERTRRLLRPGNKPPTAIFACNDEIAAGALFAARIQGVDVPRDLSIVGFEDSPFSRQSWPNLTTARQPTSTIASRAAALLIDTIKRKDRLEGPAPSEGFLPHLVVRDSTCPPPRP
ncbi:LacI family DNA-binding transcriptional regulator [Wenzhouxiangella sp. AB-CW3]|uniref:LacI family DNA-binding transcriptional regulator n=1 Tax=Wenzhouxiangella sp. AB-CW3 TaxID=2771012 RepID=UPI00168B1E6F|nr:LacI family DNA-binding transcriptional regulator [Wenzhouxiangella sp. AB-CW3]QOC21764.1 LacI family DNA-binding transcriptional regulator [Wenzhouxiangella sp. AB-CW3]